MPPLTAPSPLPHKKKWKYAPLCPHPTPPHPNRIAKVITALKTSASEFTFLTKQKASTSENICY